METEKKLDQIWPVKISFSNFVNRNKRECAIFFSNTHCIYIHLHHSLFSTTYRQSEIPKLRTNKEKNLTRLNVIKKFTRDKISIGYTSARAK